MVPKVMPRSQFGPHLGMVNGIGVVWLRSVSLVMWTGCSSRELFKTWEERVARMCGRGDLMVSNLGRLGMNSMMLASKVCPRSYRP